MPLFDPPWRLDPFKRITNVGWGGGVFVLAQLGFTAGSNSANPLTTNPWTVSAQLESGGTIENVPKTKGDNADFVNFLAEHADFALLKTYWLKPDKPDPLDPLIVYDPVAAASVPPFSDFYQFTFERASAPSGFFTCFNETIFINLSAAFAFINTGLTLKKTSLSLKFRFHRTSNYEDVPLLFRFVTSRLPSAASSNPITKNVVDNFLQRDLPAPKIIAERQEVIRSEVSVETLPLADVATISVTPAGALGSIVFTTED